MLKKATVLTRPTPARRDAPCPRRGRISIHFRGGWDDPNCSSASRAPSNLAAVLRAGGLAASDCARHHPLQSEKQRVPGTPSAPARNDQSCVRDARAGGISLAAPPSVSACNFSYLITRSVPILVADVTGGSTRI